MGTALDGHVGPRFGTGAKERRSSNHSSSRWLTSEQNCESLFSDTAIVNPFTKITKRPSGPSRERSAAAPQQATPDSLRQQVHAYRGEIARLRAENQVLGEQLARKLGAARAESVTKGAGHIEDMSPA